VVIQGWLDCNSSAVVERMSLTKSAWKNCWVCDACWTSECEAQCSMVKQTVSALGGELKIFKTGRRFAQWSKWRSFVDSTPLLVTSWRETKSCFHIMMQQTAIVWPVCTIILCTDQQQYARAMEWAGSMPNKIHVYEQSNIPLAAFGGWLYHCFGECSTSMESTLWNPASNSQSVLSGMNLQIPHDRSSLETASVGCAIGTSCARWFFGSGRSGSQADNHNDDSSLCKQSVSTPRSYSCKNDEPLTTIIARFAKPCEQCSQQSFAILSQPQMCGGRGSCFDLS